MTLPKPLTITFLGRSGCGKGTQAKLLMDQLKIELYISTGDLARDLSQKETLAGKKVAQILQKGDFLPSWLAYTLWQRELVEKLVGPEQDIILDGSPRWLEEARFLDEVMTWYERPLPTPVLLDITREEATKRLRLRGRPDDTEENINNRLDWYEKETVSVIEYYEKQGRLVRVDGMPPPGKVFDNLLAGLGLKLMNSKRD